MIQVALCTDNNYAMPAGVMIHSVCRHTANVSFHVVVSDTFSSKNRSRLEAVVRGTDSTIDFVIFPNDLVRKFPVSEANQPEHISITAYYRLFLAQLLPFDKVIYLDCDLICLKSLKELWQTDLGDAPIACVNDVPRPWQHQQQRLGYDDSYIYFNSGVLLVNLDYWRKHNVLDSFIQFVRTDPDKIVFHDQDVLNYFFHETAMQLPPCFNATDIFFHREFLDYNYPFTPSEVEAARNNPVIVHFTYRNKPWIKGGSHTYMDVFLSYKRETPWKRMRLRVKKANSLKGFLANILVILGLYRYHDDYIRLK